jgi:SulP family sulfate permease
VPEHTDIPSEPYSTLVKAFSTFGELDPVLFQPLPSYFERLSVPEGTILWKQGDMPDGMYIIQAGVLRATYQFAEHTKSIEESMVPGTLAGELSCISVMPRNATAVVERQAVLWKLTLENLKKMETEHPSLARIFLTMVLKGKTGILRVI